MKKSAIRKMPGGRGRGEDGWFSVLDQALCAFQGGGLSYRSPRPSCPRSTGDLVWDTRAALTEPRWLGTERFRSQPCWLPSRFHLGAAVPGTGPVGPGREPAGPGLRLPGRHKNIYSEVLDKTPAPPGVPWGREADGRGRALTWATCSSSPAVP